jgi:trans-aconitate methyltransferase
VGCGPGTITVDLARRVASGPVLGIDVAPDIIAEARAAGLSLGVET